MTTSQAIWRFIVRSSFLAWASVLISALVAATAYAQKAPKIGVVNFREVALQSQPGKAAKAKLEKLASQLQKEVKAEEAKFQALQKEFEAGASRFTSAERQRRSEAIEREEMALKRLVQDKTEEFKKAEADSVATLARQIEPVIRAYGAEKGFTLILEARRPGLIYYNKDLDLTSEILKRFDKSSK